MSPENRNLQQVTEHNAMQLQKQHVQRDKTQVDSENRFINITTTTVLQKLLL